MPAIGDPITTIVTANAVVSASFTDIAFRREAGRDSQCPRLANGSNCLYLASVNNLKEDTFFIKALPLTSFSSEEDSRLVNSFGITFQWKITTSLKEQYLNSVASHLSQQTYQSAPASIRLHWPGSHEQLPRKTSLWCTPASKNNQTWTPIIPNSQLLVMPPYTGNDWTLGMYISSVEKIKQVVAITAIILIIIGHDSAVADAQGEGRRPAQPVHVLPAYPLKMCIFS
jgi:hypothetical protein